MKNPFRKRAWICFCFVLITFYMTSYRKGKKLQELLRIKINQEKDNCFAAKIFARFVWYNDKCFGNSIFNVWLRFSLLSAGENELIKVNLSYLQRNYISITGRTVPTLEINDSCLPCSISYFLISKHSKHIPHQSGTNTHLKCMRGKTFRNTYIWSEKKKQLNSL